MGSISTTIHLAYVQEFGLSHLILELARLFPDTKMQKVLLETYNTSVPSNGQQENGWCDVHFKDKKISKKGKGKAVVVEGSGELHYFTLTTILTATNNFSKDNETRRFWLKGFQLNQGRT